MLAANYGHKEIIVYLIDKDANLDIDVLDYSDNNVNRYKTTKKEVLGLAWCFQIERKALILRPLNSRQRIFKHLVVNYQFMSYFRNPFKHKEESWTH
jgi:hypothetical protein